MNKGNKSIFISYTNPQTIVISAGIAVIQLPWMVMPNTTQSKHLTITALITSL